MSNELRSEIRRAAVGNFVANLVINGAIAWWLLGGHAVLSLWDAPAYGPDLLATGFLLSAAVAAIVMAINRRKARRGNAQALASVAWTRLVDGRSAWTTSLSFGLLGAALSAVVLGVLAIATDSLTGPVYAALKGVWAGVLAAAIAAPATLLGLQAGARGRVEA